MVARFNTQLRYHDQLSLAAITAVLAVAAAIYFTTNHWIENQVDLSDHIPTRNVPLFQVDLNNCHWYELVILPGIGETLAKAIVEHRHQHGNFSQIEQIQDIRGIGPGKFEQLAPHLSLNR